MKKLRRLFCLGCLALLGSVAWAQKGEPTVADSLTWVGRTVARLDSLVALPLMETSQVGLYVRDLTTGQDVYRLNHRQRLRPASCQKVVTAVAALHHLGSEYQLKTRMALTGEVRDSVLWGDVCVVGGMDPMLAQGEVMQMARLVREAGIDSVAGVVRLDLTMKNADERGWGWCWDDDVTPLKPLLVDKRDRFARELMADLAAVGVKGVTEERFVQSTCPEGARPLCEAFHTVDQVLQRMMKRSDNYYAESLFYQLGTLSGRRNIGRKEAVAYIDVTIREAGLTPADYQIADGSGLSLYNYLTPEMLVALLAYAWHNEPIRQSLYPSLPVAGVDGTLEKRMRRTAAQGNVHAKTGTVEGVSSLAGYCTSAEGHVLAFSIINQGIAKTALGRNWQDKVCEALCQPN